MENNLTFNAWFWPCKGKVSISLGANSFVPDCWGFCVLEHKACEINY